MLALVAHAILAAAPFSVLIAEPGRDFVTGPLEKAALVSAAALFAAPAALAVRETVVVGPSGTFITPRVAGVVTVKGHGNPPAGTRPVRHRPETMEETNGRWSPFRS
jgi:hypothetical protein